jgi:hypothetical protein
MERPAKLDLNELAPTPEARLALWRETLAHLRHLSDDGWRGFRCFVMLDVALLLGLAVLFARPAFGKSVALLALVLSLFGIVVTVAARYVLKRHRIYYLQMLAKKSLVEDELGFYEVRLGQDADLAFPWRLAPEVVAEIRQDAAAWVQKALRGRKTITFAQFVIYDLLLVMFGATTVAAVVGLVR